MKSKCLRTTKSNWLCINIKPYLGIITINKKCTQKLLKVKHDLRNSYMFNAEAPSSGNPK